MRQAISEMIYELKYNREHLINNYKEYQQTIYIYKKVIKCLKNIDNNFLKSSLFHEKIIKAPLFDIKIILKAYVENDIFYLSYNTYIISDFIYFLYGNINHQLTIPHDSYDTGIKASEQINVNSDYYYEKMKEIFEQDIIKFNSKIQEYKADIKKVKKDIFKLRINRIFNMFN